jgi:DNA-nicking Smr family endonuclease
VVKKLKDQSSDDQMFRQEMTGVVPLKTSARTDSRSPRSAAGSRRPADYRESSDPSVLSDAESHLHIESEDGSSLRKNGVRKRTMVKLKRGHFATGAELDLHNMTTKTAYRVLLDFIADAHSKSLDSVRIIHGKGLRSESEPKLKLMTRQILRDHPHVMAYTSCKAVDGGSGAVDVLLKTS